MGNVRALIVDDDDNMRAVLRSYINAADDGVEIVAEATRGTEALAACSAEHPDVVVLDLHLPGPDGLEVAHRILDADPDQPIVVFSAYLHPAVVGEAERIGVCECLAKTDIATLPHALWRHGRRRRDEAASQQL
jgi:DNA-binding NarL/FixJ family response regulator